MIGGYDSTNWVCIEVVTISHMASQFDASKTNSVIRILDEVYSYSHMRA